MIREFTALDGALLIDKPAGPTSHDVVDAIRRKFGLKKVGHCGTLDPAATGLLIIVLGQCDQALRASHVRRQGVRRDDQARGKH